METLLKTIKKYFAKSDNFQDSKEVQPPTFEEIHGSTSEEKRILYYLRETKSSPKPQVPKKISFEFIPGVQSNRNVRSYLEFCTGDFKAWQKISRECEAKSNEICSICGRSSKEEIYGAKPYHTETHEVWTFDLNKNIQKLVALQSLCVKCHQIKHLNQFDKSSIVLPSFEGVSREDAIKIKLLQAKKEEAEIVFFDLLRRYRVLNCIFPGEAKKDYEAAKAARAKLAGVKFSLDLSLINEQSNFDCHSAAFNKFLLGWKNGGQE